MPQPVTLAEWRASLPPERIDEYQRVLRERIGLDLRETPHRKIDLSQVARIAGVKSGTPTQWKRRSRAGNFRFPFPREQPESFPEKPLYDPVEICAWLDATGRFQTAVPV